MKKSLLLLIAVMSIQQIALAGGPWTKNQGTLFAKLSQWWLIFDEHYTDQGLLDPNVTTGVFNTSLYLEYGLTDRLTTVVNAPLLSRNYMNNLRSRTTNEILVEGEAINTLGDIDLSVKYAITPRKASIPVSATLTLGLPTGKTNQGKLQNLQTGDGEFNQMIRIDAGKSWQSESVSSYLTAYTGFNHRTNGFSEEIRLGAEFGLGLAKEKLWLTTRLDIVESLKNGLTAESISSTSIFANNTEFTSVGLEISYKITPSLGISAGAAGAVRGEIIAAAPSYSVGVFLDLN